MPKGYKKTKAPNPVLRPPFSLGESGTTFKSSRETGKSHFGGGSNPKKGKSKKGNPGMARKGGYGY
ncbi:hypothetical protein [uncultured Mediterranean phage]|nr:hypothetical protein [uncultured Mediterranean phage]